MNKLKVLILASYCGGDNKDCSDELPCNGCLQMCNVAVIETSSIIENLGGMDYLKDIKNENST